MGWAIAILPYLEQQPIFDLFDFSGTKHYNSTAVNASGVSNQQAGQNSIQEYLCPSDLHTEPFSAHGNTAWAVSSYRAVAGVIDRNSTTVNLWWDRLNEGQITLRANNRQLRGAMPAASNRINASPIKIGQITDGTSKSMLVGEYVQAERSPRSNVWASGWRYHSKGHLIRGENEEVALYRIPDTTYCATPPVSRGDTVTVGGGGDQNLCFRTFTTVHAGGAVQFVYCDGSVRSVPDGVDGDVYLSLGTIAGEEVFNFDF